MPTVRENLQILLQQRQDFELQLEQLRFAKNILQDKKVDLEGQAATVLSSKSVYAKALDALHNTSLDALEALATKAVKYIFEDKQYSVKLRSSDVRGKSMSIMLVDESWEPPREIDSAVSVGMGIRTVISYIIQTFFILSDPKQANILFIDEGYNRISSQYMDRFLQFAAMLCEEKKMALVLITHDDRVLPYADHTYIVADGTVTYQEGLLYE